MNYEEVKQLSTEDLTNAYIKLRDKKEEIKAESTSKIAKIEERMLLIKAALLERMNEAGSDQLKVNGIGTISRVVKTTFTCVDSSWNDFFRWVYNQAIAHKENGWEFIGAYMQKRLLQKGIENYVKEHNVLPKGVESKSEADIQVRRA